MVVVGVFASPSWRRVPVSIFAQLGHCGGPRSPWRPCLFSHASHGLSPHGRWLHVALLAPGLGDALSALPGASKDNKGHISVPVPDPKLERLAELERTRAVPAIVEVAEVEREFGEELERAVQGTDPAEFSGKLLAAFRAADAIILAVPCRDDEDPVHWLQSAERHFAVTDLQAMEQKLCLGGCTGPSAELDATKLKKSLLGSKDAAVRRDADELVRHLLVPGFTILRERLRAGFAARGARAGLGGSKVTMTLDPRFENLARGWLNELVTWRPVYLLADVPEANAGDESTAAEEPAGNAASRRLSAHAMAEGMPCLTVCTALEGETVALSEDPEFLAEYLASFGLQKGGSMPADSDGLRPWRSRSSELARQIPWLLNLQTFYTAGEKEAKAWMCSRVRKDGSPLAYRLLGSAEASSAAAAGKVPKGGALRTVLQAKGGSSSVSHEEDGVPASVAARAIHSSFENRLKHVDVWRFEDLDELGTFTEGPRAKERAKSAGKARRFPAQVVLQEGDVVEFGLT